MNARVAVVWDKGSAAVFDVAVESERFEATWSLFAPRCGAFGGHRARLQAPRGNPGRLADRPDGHEPGRPPPPPGRPAPPRIDPEAAKKAGMPRPIMHGLCTTGGAHPADLRELEGRFAAPVFPGDTLRIETWKDDASATLFEATADDRTVISAALARFA
ncbi:MaoC/PaaZ C-terminal domain-containing protein [Actinomadura sp. NAK00032]|uniref:MaoC/PaaZ C-terminal domain-containing protein n=1 Tax=Actinomadura sp. NAK00032 TaxID=2742128 RepID=UPI001C37CEB9|nr:MaoC/PaaZ C-terminal domain-containing protein [Actinomadura sp. NAK00032]